MTDQATRARHFLRLHHGDTPLLLPNPWDAGSAKLFASLGFHALATTSSGHAATLGRLDGGLTRDEALAPAAPIVAATDLPVAAYPDRTLARVARDRGWEVLAHGLPSPKRSIGFAQAGDGGHAPAAPTDEAIKG